MARINIYAHTSEAKVFTYISSIFLLTALVSSAFHPMDNYLINCGSPSNSSLGDRDFMSDSSSLKFLSTPEDVLASIGNTIYSKDPPLNHTARIFTKTSAYIFPIRQQGRHWIRLHFAAPFVYESYNTRSARFSVLTDNHVLLEGFSVARSAVVKEFSLSVASDSLAVMFSPSAGSFAFLNAIEVVSVPSELIRDAYLTTVDGLGPFQGLQDYALETVWRVNMGGPMVSFEEDPLSRTWVPDQAFLEDGIVVKNISSMEGIEVGTNQNFAPLIVYGTAAILNSFDDLYQYTNNITWRFQIDQGFRYLVRFHFCDIISDSSKSFRFNVYIDSWNVAREIDLNYTRRALYKDYVTNLAVSNKLMVSIGPSKLPGFHRNAILNGLEIMKINNSHGGLSAVVSSGHSNLEKNGKVIAISASIGTLILIAALALAFFSISCRKKGNSAFGYKPKSRRNHGIWIPLTAIQEATDDFDESRVIGSGGFGKVYKGVLSDGTEVAVKRKNPGSQQGLVEFRTEIEMLSQFRHRHLVSLIGYCYEGSEMILVYEFVANGTLRSYLYGSGLPILSWKQRLEICIGAARGLHYLHTGFEKAIIHRDVKSVNILLDENLRAKVADFGLSKIGPDINLANHVTTAVKGSFGYLDPEYFMKRQLTTKSDVYSFGVVLFEILCGRAAVDTTLPTEEIGLAGWAMKWQKTGELERIVDPVLQEAGEIGPNSLLKFGEIAEKCLAEIGAKRPSMGEVLRDLERALRLHEAESALKGNRENN